MPSETRTCAKCDTIDCSGKRHCPGCGTRHADDLSTPAAPVDEGAPVRARWQSSGWRREVYVLTGTGSVIGQINWTSNGITEAFVRVWSPGAQWDALGDFATPEYARAAVEKRVVFVEDATPREPSEGMEITEAMVEAGANALREYGGLMAKEAAARCLRAALRQP